MSKILRTGLGVLVLIALAIAGFHLYRDYSMFESQTPVHRNAMPSAVALGDTKEFILSRFDIPYFVVGAHEPSFTFSSAGHGPIFVTDYYDGPGKGSLTELPEGEQVEDYNFWGYSIYQLKFDPKTDRLVEISCGPFDEVQFEKEETCRPSFGVEIGDSESVVISKLGSPSYDIVDDSRSTTLRYEDLGVDFKLDNVSRRVTNIGWFVPEGGTGAILLRYLKIRLGL
jgi:hypothetical protein